jgi:DnaJ-class molecular chaperone
MHARRGRQRRWGRPCHARPLGWLLSQVLKIKGEGMPVHDYPSEKGDLEVHITVEFPQRLTEDQRNGACSLRCCSCAAAC